MTTTDATTGPDRLTLGDLANHIAANAALAEFHYALARGGNLEKAYARLIRDKTPDQIHIINTLLAKDA